MSAAGLTFLCAVHRVPLVPSVAFHPQRMRGLEQIQNSHLSWSQAQTNLPYIISLPAD